MSPRDIPQLRLFFPLSLLSLLSLKTIGRNHRIPVVVKPIIGRRTYLRCRKNTSVVVKNTSKEIIRTFDRNHTNFRLLSYELLTATIRTFDCNHTNFRLLSYNHNPHFLTPPPVASGTTTHSLLHRHPLPPDNKTCLPSLPTSPCYKQQGRRHNSRCVKVRRLSAFPRCRKKNNKKARQTDVSKQIKMFFNEKSPISLIFIQL